MNHKHLLTQFVIQSIAKIPDKLNKFYHQWLNIFFVYVPTFIGVWDTV